MRITLFNTLLSVKEGRAELDNYVEQEDEVDSGIDELNRVAEEERVTLVFIEELDGDEQGVVEREENDQVVPVLDESSTACEEKLLSSHRLVALPVHTLTVAVLTCARAVLVLRRRDHRLLVAFERVGFIFYNIARIRITVVSLRRLLL